MNFIYKAIAHNIISTMPSGSNLNFLLKKYITKTLPRNDIDFQDKINDSRIHLSLYEKYSKKPIDKSTYYEFGAGFDLISQIAMKFFGFNSLYLVDIENHLNAEIINNTAQRMCNFLPHAKPLTQQISTMQDAYKYLNSMNINYQAPCDARDTQFEACHFDLIASTVTLEHIPPEDIVKIMLECRRVLADDGVISFVIDYRDHYSYFDKNISVYNFLQYDDDKWKKYNPSSHYQNRLRHIDFINIFKSCDYEILEDNPGLATEEEINQLKNIKISSRFKDYSVQNLSIKSGWFVLKKNI